MYLWSRVRFPAYNILTFLEEIIVSLAQIEGKQPLVEYEWRASQHISNVPIADACAIEMRTCLSWKASGLCHSKVVERTRGIPGHYICDVSNMNQFSIHDVSYGFWFNCSLVCCRKHCVTLLAFPYSFVWLCHHSHPQGVHILCLNCTLCHFWH